MTPNKDQPISLELTLDDLTWLRAQPHGSSPQ